MAEDTLNNQTANGASLDEEIAAAEAELKAAEERLSALRKQANEETPKAEAEAVVAKDDSKVEEDSAEPIKTQASEDESSFEGEKKLEEAEPAKVAEKTEEFQAAPAEQPAQPEANIPGFTPYNPTPSTEPVADYSSPQNTAQSQSGYYENSGYTQGQNSYYNYNYNGYANQQQPGNNAYQNYYVPPTQTTSSKDHVAAGLLAIFLGSLGIHKFYLGYNTPGFIMLAVSILGSLFTFGLAGAVMGIIAIVEGIIYLTRSQSEFEAIYVTSKREWF